MPPQPTKSFVKFKSVVILIMGLAAIVAFVTARWPETIALAAVMLINTAIGFFGQWRAVRSMEALRQLDTSTGTTGTI